MLERLSEVLVKREGDIPVPPYVAHHAGRLIGLDEFRQGPLVVTWTLENTAVVEVDGLRQLARLQDLEVEAAKLNWVTRRQASTWRSGAKGHSAVIRNRRPRPH
ncbi:hypothetical protein [Candidatus Nephthysia bennettiae]|uniref:Uncharacterized protein n=1 Tax=Candidatus Nephthysia bennettiae TaxID=3127016 RepID=A0A934N494_9BACT|nr:hypothetical protein [Candidatus Dormibacteraeota bacterium]